MGDGGGSTPDFCFLSEVEHFPCSLTYTGLFSLPLQRLGTPNVCLFFRARYFCLRWLFLLTPDFCFLSEVEHFPCSLTYTGLFSLPLQRLGTPNVCLFFRARYFCLRWLFLLTPIAAVYRIHKSIFFAFFYFVKFKSQHINKIFTLKPLTVFREVHNGNVPQTKKREN